MSTWSAKTVKHKGEERIAVYFEKDKQLIERIKKLKDARWSYQLNAWHLPDNEENRKRFKIPVKEILSPVHQQKMNEFKIWLETKRYSPNTVKSYLEALFVFLRFYHAKPIEDINNQDIVNFNNDYILKNEFSASYQNQIVNAIKLFFKQIQQTVIDVDLIHRPRREHLLPNVLSKEEIKMILEALSNIKHRAMLSLIYSCGLRRSELLNLKPNDIDSRRKLIIVRQSKGKKDRIVPLSPKILELLREYYKYYKPKTYLFEGQVPNEPYDARSLANVLKSALKKCGITKPVSLHWLRHSYATHLLEIGTDLRYIQEILGHNSSRTTEIYTHVSNKSLLQIKSPFDDL
ncbi:MAG: site-specific tyrosine recombinase/integron integrase [Bacteroidia bacterium]